MVRGLNKTWASVAGVSPSDPTFPMIAGSWVLKYRAALQALEQNGCPAPPDDLAALDQSINELSQASEATGYAAVPNVSRELRTAAEAYGIHVAGPTTCAQLARKVRASFVLRDAGAASGQDLYPVVTVANGGSSGVLVKLAGEGEATSDSGVPMTMSWGGYTDSRLTIDPGKSASLSLGKDTGETLYVGPGQHVTKAIMTATASSTDGSLSDCKVPVARQ
jgi:hypothetical protein